MDTISNVPLPVNEAVHDYAPGSPERTKLTLRLEAMATERVELTMAIGGEHRLGGGERIDVVQPVRGRVTGRATTRPVAAAPSPGWSRFSWRRLQADA